MWKYNLVSFGFLVSNFIIDWLSNFNHWLTLICLLLKKKKRTDFFQKQYKYYIPRAKVSHWLKFILGALWKTNFGVFSFYTAHGLKLKFVSRWKLNEINKGNINWCSKCINLKTNFINILWENNKIINFLKVFYILYESGV